ncbi:hypothetical protein BOTCAL_0065g00140 [Botryotinia calthae]|uniref:Uncharacterized protein n=1 Tax=Botryotinia calthae TaxID=38488 RepID=A0A4Y8DBT3_9HELO|nr:hypothetical protein BOTCAL_0065g00140 [Botryotinia calthae]
MDLGILVRIFNIPRLPLIVWIRKWTLSGEDCIWDELQIEPSSQSRAIELCPRTWVITSRKTLASRCDVVRFTEAALFMTCGETLSFVMEEILAC